MKKLATTASVAVLALAGFLVPASAQVDGDGGEGAVTATLTGAMGTRSVTTVAPIVLTGALSALPTDDYSVVVNEVSRTGTNPWSVSGRVCGPNAVTPIVSDCVARGDQLTNAGGTSNVAGSALAAAGRAVSELVPGGSGTLTTPSGSEAFSQARTLFTNSLQSTSLLYTETYTGTGNLTLTPPDGTAADTYAGFFVVTLTQ